MFYICFNKKKKDCNVMDKYKFKIYLMSKSWRAIVASYNKGKDEGTLYKIITVYPQVSWTWVKPEEIEDDNDLTQNYVSSIVYKDAECQTETKMTQKQDALKNIKVSFPVEPYHSFLPCFDEIVDPSYLEAPTIPSIIHKIDLNAKTAIVSYQNSTNLKSVDLYFLMSIDPVGVAKYLTTQH